MGGFCYYRPRALASHLRQWLSLTVPPIWAQLQETHICSSESLQEAAYPLALVSAFVRILANFLERTVYGGDCVAYGLSSGRPGTRFLSSSNLSSYENLPFGIQTPRTERLKGDVEMCSLHTHPNLGNVVEVDFESAQSMSMEYNLRLG